jgi:RNA polymerase-binding transcription factor DksA
MAKVPNKSSNKAKEKGNAPKPSAKMPSAKPATPAAKSSAAKAPAKPITKTIEKPASKSFAKPSTNSTANPVAKASEKPGTGKIAAKPAMVSTNGKAVAKAPEKPADKGIGKTAKMNGGALEKKDPTSARFTSKPEKAAVRDRDGSTRFTQKSAASRAIERPISTRFTSKSQEKAAIAELKLKCPFPTDELVRWRQVLIERRSEITNDIAGLVKDAMEAEDGHTTPNHIAERGSDADLQDMSLGMVGEEETILWQIDRALRKIEKSMPLPFGLCEFTKEPIPKTRLQLIPWTPLSIEGATHMEQNHMSVEDMLIED